MASTALNAPSLESEHIRPYVDLSEKLGQVLTQIVDERVEELEIAYSGRSPMQTLSRSPGPFRPAICRRSSADR